MNKATVAGQQAAIAYHNSETSLEKLTKSANTSRIAMIGLQAATTLLNTALTTGITLLMQTGINKLVNIYQEFADRQKEAADAAEEFNNTLNSIEDYQKKIDELRESLDKEGISQADATEKRKELLKIKDELFEMYGDEADKRNAITDAINGETNALLRLQGITAQESNLTNAKSIKEANDYLNERHSYTVDLKNTYTFSEKHKGEIDNFLRDYVHSHAEIDFNNTNENSVWGYNSLYFSGTRDEIIQQITDFNNAIEEEINTNKDLTQDEIQKLRDIQVSNSETINWIADKDNQTLENNHTIIETAAKNALFIDGVYNDLYQKYKDAQSDYNDAIAKGDTDAIETAYKNVQSAYNDLISGIDHDVGQVNKDYIVEYIDGIQEQFESSNIDVSLPIRIKIDIDNNTIPENVIDAVENLNNEQGKIVDWGLTQYGSAFDTDGTSFVQTLFGNIDMDKRAIITWSDELKQVYKDELASWDYDPDIGMIDTVFGGWDMFSNGDTEVAIAFSPIMVDENGNAKLLSKDTVKEYLNGIIKEATHDGVIDEQVLFRLDAQGTSEYGIKNNIKGIIAGIDTDLTDGNDADILSRLMHFSGAYGALGSEVGAYMSTLQAYADTLGVSLDSLIDAFVSLGYIQEENINTQKQATFSITEYSDSISEYQKNIKTLQDAYNKLIKGELSENDVLDLIIDKFPDLINYTGDLENGIKALANKEYDVLLSKLKEVDTAHLSEADLNTYKTLISYIGQINSGFDITIDKLTEIQSRIKNTSSLISNLQSMSKEISDNGYLSLSSITTILTDDDYISLRPYLDDVVSLNNQINTLIKEQKNYYNELANQTLNRFNLIEEETKKIEEEYNIDLLNYEKLSNDKKKELENTNAYMLSQINDFINDINDKYDIDVRNYKDATSAKLAILNSFKETAAYSNVEAIPEVAVASAMGGFGNYMFLDRVSDITIRKANEELRTLGLTWQDYVQYKKNGVFSYSSNKSLDDNLALIYEQYKNNSSNVSIDWDKINSSGSSTSSEISNSTSEANKYFDWIERRLKRFANTTKEVFSKVKDYITFSGKNSQLSQAINAIRDEIAVNEQSYQYYMNEANAVGLDPYWQWFVQNGGGNISNIQDSDLSEKISRYQELYDKAIECSNAISGLKETELEYANQMLSNVEKYYSNRITYANADAEYYNSLDTDNLNMTKNFDAIRKSYNEQLSYTQKEQNDLLNTLNSLVANGSIKYQSDEWYEWWGKIQKCNVEIRTLTKSIHDLANERLENIQSFWDNRIADANADAEFYNSLDTDNQNMSKNLDAIRESYNKQLSYTKNKKQELIKELNAMVNSGDIEKYSDKWYEWQEKINECEVSIRNLTKSIHDLANERLENIQSFWDNRIGNYDNAISYINTINGDTTRKGSKNYQQLSSAYNAQISYTQKEISELQAALDKAVKNGDIEKYSDKWYEWVSIIEQGKKTIIELQTSIHHLAVDQFNDIVTKYDNLLNDIEYQENLLTERITQTEEKGYIVSTKFYDALISNEQKNISLLVSQRKELYSKLQQAIKSGDIQEGSEEWYKMIQEINNVDLAIEKANTSIIKFNNSIRDIQWQVFDLLQDKISQITQESNFLINLMENDNLYVKEGRRAGQLTNKGLSTMGLHGVNYNVYMAQAKKYAEEILNIDKQIAKDPYNQDLINRRQELLKLQQDMIISANDEKQAIANMVKEGIDLELNALKKLIDKYNEALDAEKNLYDYQKKIKEQTKEINSLEKQLMAYANDTSEETKTKVQQIKVNLETAKENLQETQYDKFVSDQKKLLDDLYNDYETISNQRLDNIDGLISEMIADINDNANTIRRTLIDKAGSVGYQISSEIKNIWNNKTNPVLSEYGQNFLNTSNNVIIAINSLTSSINNMNKALGITVDTNNKAIRKETAVTPTIIHRGSAMRLYNDNVNNLQNYYNGFKQGSYSINRNQMAWTNENGNSEVIIRKSDGAILTPLAKDDMILNGYATDNLFSMANDPSKFIKDNLFGASQYNGTSNINNVNSNYSVSVDNINLNLPNVKNYEDFFYAAQHDKRFEKMVRAMTVDKLFGGSSLKKYRI